MSLEITGKLLEKYDEQVVSDRFKKREFVLELVNDTPAGNFTNYAKMQLVQNKTELIDRFNKGDFIKVHFDIKGNRYEKNGTVSYFSNLDAWRIEPAEGAAGNAAHQGGYDAVPPSGGYNSNFSAPSGNGNNIAVAPAAEANSASNFSASASSDGTGDDLPF